MEVRLVASHELDDRERDAIRSLLDDAFDGRFSDDDWDHTLGGSHALVVGDAALIAHGALIERPIEVGGRPRRVGYVEGVATVPSAQRRGAGSAVMRRLGELITERFELGALSTGAGRFYARLGWERWEGPTAVRRPDGSIERTPEDDDGVMILRTPATVTFAPPLDVTGTIICDHRTGDVW
ncbi:MAG: GNAT family N-acetyltransferase [Ilumatobacter sp.]|nr:GNAT family N-acetyltransferase [Ilumatobacter sp.]